MYQRCRFESSRSLSIGVAAEGVSTIQDSCAWSTTSHSPGAIDAESRSQALIRDPLFATCPRVRFRRARRGAARLRLAPRPRRGASRSVRVAFVGTASKGGKPLLTGASALIVQQGFLEAELEKRGVALEWVPMPNAAVGPMTNEAFANGGIDFANYSELPSIIANANGIRTKLIVPSGRGATPSSWCRRARRRARFTTSSGSASPFTRGARGSCPSSVCSTRSGSLMRTSTS